MASSSEDLHAALEIINKATPAMLKGAPAELLFSANLSIVKAWATVDVIEHDNPDEEGAEENIFLGWLASTEKHPNHCTSKARQAYTFVSQKLQMIQEHIKNERLERYYAWKSTHPELHNIWRSRGKNDKKDRQDAVAAFCKESGFPVRELRQDLCLHEIFMSRELRPSLFTIAFNMGPFLKHRMNGHIPDRLLKHPKIQQIAQDMTSVLSWLAIAFESSQSIQMSKQSKSKKRKAIYTEDTSSSISKPNDATINHCEQNTGYTPECSLEFSNLFDFEAFPLNNFPEDTIPHMMDAYDHQISPVPPTAASQNQIQQPQGDL